MIPGTESFHPLFLAGLAITSAAAIGILTHSRAHSTRRQASALSELKTKGFERGWIDNDDYFRSVIDSVVRRSDIPPTHFFENNPEVTQEDVEMLSQSIPTIVFALKAEIARRLALLMVPLIIALILIGLFAQTFQWLAIFVVGLFIAYLYWRVFR